MLTITDGNFQTCQGLQRRRLLQIGGAGLAGLSLPRILAAESQDGAARPSRAKSVIFLFLFGGPSQLETFDMKPDAPAEIRGPFQPISSRTSGLRICEHLPELAKLSDRFAVIKTMSHHYNDHSGGAHFVQTGHPWHVPIGGGFNVTPNDWPAMGAVVKYFAERGAGPGDVPPYMVTPNFLGRLQDYKVQLRRPGETAGWLGRPYDPLTTRIDKRDAKDNPYFRACTDAELDFQIEGLGRREDLTLRRVAGRRSLLDQLDESRRLLEASSSIEAYDEFRQQAMALVASPTTRDALNVRREPAALRERYGRSLFGQSTLVARRLVEAGVRFVTVHYDAVDGYSWDSHRNSDDVKRHLLPSFDQALAALLADLEDRGMLDETLVVAMGEMGRTPKANKVWGRNHWSTLFPAVVAGAGVAGGVIHGETDRQAAYATTTPVRPQDLSATIFDALGIDPRTRVPDQFGRPHPIAADGKALHHIFG